jgi:hypothetical protein
MRRGVKPSPVHFPTERWRKTSRMEWMTEDTDCFTFGGYTSGGVPEVMVVNAPVVQAVVTEIP